MNLAPCLAQPSQPVPTGHPLLLHLHPPTKPPTPTHDVQVCQQAVFSIRVGQHMLQLRGAELAADLKLAPAGGNRQWGWGLCVCDVGEGGGIGLSLPAI